MHTIIRGQMRSFRATSVVPHFGCRQVQRLLLQFFLFSCLSRSGASQCTGIASTPKAAADCAARSTPTGAVTSLDAAHTYSLAELIDLAERNNPRTRIAWERARQRADALGIARSSYFPVLAGQAAFADQRFINPFPKPLAPRGYTMVEVPAVVPEVTLEYLIFDFGKREARVDAATAAKLAAGANFIQANQDVAFLPAAHSAGTTGRRRGDAQDRADHGRRGRGPTSQRALDFARRAERPR
jgi:outer membrane protein